MKGSRPLQFETDSKGKLVITEGGEGGDSSQQPPHHGKREGEGEEKMEVEEKVRMHSLLMITDF